MRPQRAKKRDDNAKEIIQELRAQGCFVQDMGAVGGGVADLVVGFRGLWHILEVKDGSKDQCKRILTPAQIAWVFDVKNRAPVHVVETVEQALAVVCASRQS